MADFEFNMKKEPTNSTIDTCTEEDVDVSSSGYPCAVVMTDYREEGIEKSDEYVNIGTEEDPEYVILHKHTVKMVNYNRADYLVDVFMKATVHCDWFSVIGGYSPFVSHSTTGIGTARHVYPISSYNEGSPYGSKIRITIPYGGTPWQFGNVWFGHVDPDGGTADFDGNQVRLTINGEPNKYVTEDVVSDEIDFDFDPTKEFLISNYFSSPTDVPKDTTVDIGYSEYLYGGNAVSDTVFPGGFYASHSNEIIGFSKVEVCSIPSPSVPYIMGPFDTFTENLSQPGGYTIRHVFSNSNYNIGVSSGNAVRLTMAYISTVWGVTEAWIGHRASGSLYNFDGNQVQLFYLGSSSKFFTSDNIQSDMADFDFDPTKDIVISVYFGTGQSIPSDVSVGINFNAYVSIGNVAGNTSVSASSLGYITNRITAIKSIKLFNK